MMQQYEFPDSAEPQSTTNTMPSDQTIHTIISFARCYQSIELAGIRMDIYLN